MKLSGSTKRIVVFAAVFILLGVLAGCSPLPAEQRLPVRVLILPKFEVGAMTGDFPGEAQCFYEEYSVP